MSKKYIQMIHRWSGRMKRVFKSPLTYLILLAIVLFIIEIVPLALPFLVDAAEDASYALAPSAYKAYEFGLVHFSATDPGDYDINRAESYFYLALAQDPQLPYVWHELARISFLKGDLPKALAQIDIQIQNEGDKTANSYYVRGLIEGYMGKYPEAEVDYAHFLLFDPHDWAGVNDYSWILLKDHKPRVATKVIEAELPYAPSNPWLLNNDAIALSELGDTIKARERIDEAVKAVWATTPQDWSYAYPGNDPNVAAEAVADFRATVAKNKDDIDSGKTLQLVQ